MLTYLRSKLKKIYCFLYAHQQVITLGLLFFVIVGVGSFFLLKPAHAFDIVDWPNFEDRLIRTAASIFLLFARLLLRIALFFLEYVIIVAGYNGYLSSTAVNVGWITVLNITNMLFVVILLIIAFATILGRTEYEWKKLLPKFFFAAILVNFSRTICGLLIDLSQVVMSAFVNAIAATIGGNVINGFQLDKIEKFNSTVKPGDLLSPGIFTASVAAVFFAAMVAAVFGAYIFILVGRMIRLWVLIVLSPLAFVLSVIPRTAGFASQWWSELGDNLVTGPVLLFFIWLSLVTVGTGQINQHILAKSNVPDANKATMDGTLYGQGFVNVKDNSGKGETPEQSAGLTDILGWNNMANFIIAIGMLFAGAQVASKIGGSSGNLMMSAIGFGKKVATIATGVAAGEWAAGHIGRAAAEAPGALGGLVLRPITRPAKKVAESFKSWNYGRKERWNAAAKQLEGVKGWKKPFARIGAWAIESGERKDKVVEDYADLTELAKKKMMINTNTSALGAGEAKLSMTELVRQEEAKSAAKKGLKFAEQQSKREKIAHEIRHKAEHFAEESGLEGEALKTATADYVKSLEGTKYATGEKDKNGKDILATFKREDIDDFNSRETTLTSQAKAEQLQKELHDSHAKEVAGIKDELVPGGGGFLDAELARQAKEKQERAGVASYDKSMAKIGSINEEIAEELGKGDRRNDKLIKALRENLNNLSLSNINRGALFGVSGEATALSSAGLTGYDVGPKLNGQNLMNAQANFLATKLGRNVGNNPEEVKKAVEELEKMMGPAYMEQMVDGLNKMSEDGASHYAGLFRGEMVEGKYKIRATDFEARDANGNYVDRGHIEGKRNWAISQSKFSKLHGFDASMDQEWDAQGKNMRTRIHSPEALDNLEKIFKGINTNQLSRLDSNNVDTLARAIQNAHNSQEVKNIFDAIEKAAAGNKKEVINALKESVRKSSALALADKGRVDGIEFGTPPTGGTGGGSGGGNRRNQNQRPRRGGR